MTMTRKAKDHIMGNKIKSFVTPIFISIDVKPDLDGKPDSGPNDVILLLVYHSPCVRVIQGYSFKIIHLIIKYYEYIKTILGTMNIINIEIINI